MKSLFALLILFVAIAEALKAAPEHKKRSPKFLSDQEAYEQVRQRQNRNHKHSLKDGPIPLPERQRGPPIEIELIKEIPAEKCPRKSQIGDLLQIYYIAYLPNGVQIDSSFKKGKPSEFILGAGKVIPAWDDGLEDMCIGEIRQLTTPADLSEAGVGNELNSLVYKVELAQILNYEWPEHLIKRDEL